MIIFLGLDGPTVGTLLLAVLATIGDITTSSAIAPVTIKLDTNNNLPIIRW
jgi:hypothetical protein